MYSDARKIHLLERLIREQSEEVFLQVEDILNRSEKQESAVVRKYTLEDFVGIWTPEEADEMKLVIDERCGQINPDDWK